MSDDQSRIYNSLRASTIALLGYDGVDPLSSAQEIRVSRAISLRLIVDSSQAKQLRGEAIDVRAFTDASESLEKMCGGNPEAPSGAHDFSGAREELRRFFAGRADAIERRELRREAEMAMDPEKFRRELELKIEAAIEKHNKPISDPGSGDAQSGDGVTLPPSAAPDVPAARSGAPLLISPAPPPPPPPPATAAERAANVERLNSQPANPVPEPLPEWRRWVDEDGIRTSPWRR